MEEIIMVETKYGKIKGVDCGEYVEYRGIPYAKPPVGEFRWKAPQPLDAFDGVYQATEFKSRSMQDDGFSAPPYSKDFYNDPAYERPVSEDSLYLNIWAPKNAVNCPVAIWIHGGAFLSGYSSEKEFDGAAYCKRGVILVSIQYRLNVFGFLAHPWLTEESGTSGNYGILDQIAALNWVHESIGAFGGDPENITIFGQSAGAMSTQTLISSPLTGNIIKKAILQSGGSYGKGLHRDIRLEEQERYGKVLSEVLGANSLEEMRAKSADEIMAAFGPFMDKVMPVAHGLFLIPTIDGKVLTGGYYELMDKGEIKEIPYMVGCTKNDIMVAPNAKLPEENPLYGGSIAFSHKLEDLGRKPAYVYYFTRDLPGDDFGAWHSSELWYMMGTMGRCWRPWTDGDIALSEKMLNYWTNFIKTGDPNDSELPKWEPCSKKNSFVMEFNA